jgi:BNR repeat-like domain
MRSAQRLRAAVTVVAVVAALPAAAFAGQTRVSLGLVSAPTPFPAGCPGAAFDDTNTPGLEVEPSITANRARPHKLAAAWIQDEGPDSSRTDVTAMSRNGGRTWTVHTIPGLTKCEGGTADSAADPWLSSGGDGTLYFAGLAPVFDGHTPLQTIVASHSVDGGGSWALPTTLVPPANGNETPAITGSPTHPGRAYEVWAEFATADIHFSMSDDRGATWAPSSVIDQPGPNALDLIPRLLVLPDGTLLTIFDRGEFDTGLGKVLATRSRDEGRTWSAPVEVARQPFLKFFDDAGEELPIPQYANSAVAPDGTVYVTVEADSSATSGEVAVIASRDGGRTWRHVTSPGVGAYAFEPAIAVDRHGTVGVTWYDLRGDRPGDAPLTADVWFASSHDHGASWHETHVAGPTDLRTAALARQNRVGEYQGLAASGPHRFVAILTLAAPFAVDGPTDIFAARIRDGGRRGLFPDPDRPDRSRP